MFHLAMISLRYPPIYCLAFIAVLFVKLRAADQINECKQDADPGFDLSCTDEGKTVLQLISSVPVKFFVKSIDYKSQVLQVYDPKTCLPEQLLRLANSSISPFQFVNMGNITFFNCSSPIVITHKFHNPSCPIYGISSYSTTTSGASYLVSCTKLLDIIGSSYDIDTYYRESTILHLTWKKLNCSKCEAKGKICKLKNNGMHEGEIECCNSPIEGSSANLVVPGAILGSFLFMIVVVGVFYIYSLYKVRDEYQERIKKFLEDYKALKPTRYSYADIKKITNQFENKLGQGGYGTVFKGQVSNEILVAVKILNQSKCDGEEFINEVGLMGKIHHVNVVRLVGFCADGIQRALVYELLPNHSLEKFIASPDMTNSFLGWEKLQDIALGVARGIEYLHQGCDQQILHFDIKPHNVLLDQDFTPKISDFGLAKLCAKNQSVVSITTTRGTMGYIAPEVFSRNFGKASYKSDVYSFGMLLLEMVAGKKNVNETVENGTEIYYPEWIYNLLKGGEDLRIHIDEEKDTDIAKKLAIVGLWCIQWYPIDRPSMKSVVQMLEGDGDKLSLPPNPFLASTGPARSKGSTPQIRMNQELEIIPELE
ncbi:Receptor-like protein kinase [Quillaja saponaria]|uniref:Receptor-like protein kinase n=1 Tax=Quillaja saponaria TaxID=32244 RepID=A0AAD7LVZ5_QUISA|nr:Receptor-like protein kinase [Quillaja saponaria]